MTWASPALGLLVAACVIPPLILLYFLKLRRREENIPSTLLWKQSVQDLQANAPFQRLRMNLLLFLQLLALLLLLVALAQPQWEGLAISGARTVILIDRSASMVATDISSNRLEEAKDQAISYVRGIRSGGLFSSSTRSEKVMVIAFDDDAKVYCPFTSSKVELEIAIKSITPTHKGTSLRQALELARAYTINTDPDSDRSIGPLASILLFSDGQIQDLQDVVARETIRYRPIGKPDVEENIGIVEFGADRTPTNLSEIIVYARVANYKPIPATVDVLFSVGNQLLVSKRIQIPPAYVVDPRKENSLDEDNSTTMTDDTITDSESTATITRPGTAAVEFPIMQPQGITLGVALDLNDDVFSPDNRAYITVPPARQLKVGLVAPKSFIPGTALSGIPFIRVIETITADQFNNLVQTGGTDRYDVIITDNEPISKLSAGRYLIFGGTISLEGFGYTDQNKPEKVLDWDTKHPINRWINYDPLYIASYDPISIPPEARVIVEGTQGPLVVEYIKGGVEAIIVAFTHNKSNWFSDENFIKFMQNTVQYLGNSGETAIIEPLKPGEALTTTVPVDAEDITLEIPPVLVGDKTTTKRLTPTIPGKINIDIEFTGLYAITYKDKATGKQHRQEYAVNLSNEFEGKMKPTQSISIGVDKAQTLSGDSALQKQPLWHWAALAAIIILMLEWWVYNRRAYI